MGLFLQQWVQFKFFLQDVAEQARSRSQCSVTYAVFPHCQSLSVSTSEAHSGKSSL